MTASAGPFSGDLFMVFNVGITRKPAILGMDYVVARRIATSDQDAERSAYQTLERGFLACAEWDAYGEDDDPLQYSRWTRKPTYKTSIDFYRALVPIFNKWRTEGAVFLAGVSLSGASAILSKCAWAEKMGNGKTQLDQLRVFDMTSILGVLAMLEDDAGGLKFKALEPEPTTEATDAMQQLMLSLNRLEDIRRRTWPQTTLDRLAEMLRPGVEKSQAPQ